MVGRIARPHGLRGEVVVDLLTDFPERFAPGLSIVLRTDSGETEVARIETVRPHGGRMLMLFAGVEDLDRANTLRERDLCVRPEDTPPRPPGYVFHHEVQGFEAVDTAGRILGVVRDLVDVGGLPLLVLSTERGERDVPFSYPIFVSIDVPERRIVLDPPNGLLD